VNEEHINYIFKYCSQFFTELEGKVLRNLQQGIQFKEDIDKSDPMTRARLKKGWISEDPNVFDLLKDGEHAFRKRTSKRILKEHKKEIKLNICPICNRLARTPKARQCRHCEYKWFHINV